jgi:hypothetical protein
MRRVIYTALAWAPVLVAAPAPGDANLAYASTSNQVVNKTVIYEDRTTYSETPVFVETVTVDKWYAPLSTPVRRKLLTDPQEYAQAPHTPFALAWARQLDTPVRRRFVVAEEGSNFSAPPKPEANDAIGWRYDLATPVRRKFTFYGDYGYGNFLPHTNDVRWYSPLDVPTRRLVRTWQIEFAQAAYTPVVEEIITADKWWRPLDEPHRVKRLPVGGYQFEARASFPQVPWGWYAKLEQPPVRLTKTPATQVSLTFVAAAPGNGNAYNWFLPLEIPTRARKLNEFPATAIPVYFVPPTPGAGNEYNWFEPLNAPHRQRPSIRTAQQQSLAVPSRLLTTTLEYAWYQPLTTPTRLDWLNRSDDAQGNVNPIVPYAWQQLDTPTRRLRSVYTAPGETPYQTEIVTVDKWFRELDKPLRIKHRFNHEAVSLAPYQFENVTIDKWWRELVRPIYTKRIDRPAIAQGNINPVVPLAWQPLHSPHRLKGRISYPFEAKATFPFAFPGNGNGTTQPWPALSEPVRLKSYYHQHNAGLVWTTTFNLPAYDPDRVVCVHVESRAVMVEAYSRTVTPTSTSRTVRPDERQSCQES